MKKKERGKNVKYIKKLTIYRLLKGHFTVIALEYVVGGLTRQDLAASKEETHLHRWVVALSRRTSVFIVNGAVRVGDSIIV